MRKERRTKSLRIAKAPLNAQGSRTPYESAARQEASPQIMRRSIRIAAVPQTAKHARRIAGGPQAHHRFRRARQAANWRHASEAKTTRYHGASRGPTPWWWFPLCTRTIKRCRCPACTARISSSKRAAWMQQGSRSRFPSSSKDSSTRAALFRNDARSTTFSKRTARLRRAKTAASKSSSRSGGNANAPQPKRRQEEHDKKPWSTLQGHRSACQRRMR